MFSIQTISLQFKSFLISGIYLFFGTLTILIPFSIFDLLFLSKWADIGPVWSIIFNIFISLLFTGFIMFFDLLIIRFLLKLRLSNKMYFVIWVITSSMLILTFALLGWV